MRIQLIISCLIFWLGMGTSLYQRGNETAVQPSIELANCHKIFNNAGQLKNESSQFFEGHPHQKQSVVESHSTTHPRILPHDRQSGFVDGWHTLLQDATQFGTLPQLYLSHTTGYLSSIRWLLYPKHSFW